MTTKHERRETANGVVHVYRTGAAPSGTVIYVHGYVRAGAMGAFKSSADRAWEANFLQEQFDRSGIATTFAVIEGQHHGNDRVRWRHLEDLLDAIGGDGPVSAVGHSGAYGTIQRWLTSPHLRHVCLLDALYAYVREFRAFARGDGRTLTLVGATASPLRNARRLLAGLSHDEREAWVRTLTAASQVLGDEDRAARILFMVAKGFDHRGVVLTKKIIPVVLQRVQLADAPLVPAPAPDEEGRGIVFEESALTEEASALPSAAPPAIEPAGEPATTEVPAAPATGSHWPVLTRNPHGREVAYRTRDKRTVGAPGRRFLAARADGTRYHAGVDLFGDLGDPVVACEDGTIAAYYHFYRGVYALLVQNDSGTVINYGEVDRRSLRSLGLKVGDRVKAGQQIAVVGRMAHDSMCHFEMYVRGTTQNPRWMKGERRPKALLDPTPYLLALATGRAETLAPALEAASRCAACDQLEALLERGALDHDATSGEAPAVVEALRPHLAAFGYEIAPSGAADGALWAAYRQFLEDVDAPSAAPADAAALSEHGAVLVLEACHRDFRRTVEAGAQPETAGIEEAATVAHYAGIVDVSSYQKGCDLAKAVREGGVTAVIAKATQGKDWRDKQFATFIPQARAVGALVGAYHFGSNSSDGRVQADFFLKVVGEVGAEGLLLCLDWEGNPDTASGTMTLENARRFVQRVREQTGRWPVLYSGASFLGSHVRGVDDVLKRCPLWVAKYGPEPKAVQKTWTRWDLWQYTDGRHGPADQTAYPRSTAGIGRCDRSVARGDAASLRAWWAAAGVDAGPVEGG